MPKPKSPLEKPGSGQHHHSRRPSGPRRTSSSDKKAAQATFSSKHAGKEPVGHVSSGRAPAMMSGSSTGGIPPFGEVSPAETQPFGAVEGLPENVQAGMKLKGGEMTSEKGSTFPDVGKQSDVKENIAGGAGRSEKETVDEIERLREAVNAQLRLSHQRERLNKSLRSQEPTGKSRVSPIHEESSIFPPSENVLSSPTSYGPETASTESAKTVRGETPGPYAASTPSYPFPPMKPFRQPSWGTHHPFTTLSPTVAPQNFGSATSFDTPRDRIASGSVTPASTANFQPPGSYQSKDDTNFPSPNLYDLSLMLAAEPGLEPWWATVVQIMRDVYKAERVTLAVPADSTDIENVPWGQKATFNPAEEDELSLAYLPRGSSLVPSSVGTNDTSISGVESVDDSPPMITGLPENVRPGLISRHSFTAYEDTKRPTTSRPENRSVAAARAPLPRSKSYFSVRPEQAPRSGTLQHADLNLRTLEEHLAVEDAKETPAWNSSNPSAREGHGRVFPVLQALDYEVDPLIDSSGVIRVLERGRVIALTRDYPYLEKQNPEKQSREAEDIAESKATQKGVKHKDMLSEKSGKKTKPDLISRASSFLGGPKTSRRSSRNRSQTGERGKIQDDISPPTLARYEEYEQHPPSPWSQSPAPSPAVRADPNENPFFADTQIDEDTFNPATSPQDYSNVQQVEAIGTDRSSTVLHIPLAHVLLSKAASSFHLDPAVMESRSRDKSHAQKPSATSSTPGKAQTKEKHTPIAILSILSPIIPYPSSLRHSLEHLAPHLATSFSLCRYHTNLETEIAGLSRKRPHTTGFGAIAPSSQAKGAMHLANLEYSPEDDIPQRSQAGSITSPSDYSGISRSAAGSPAATPGWEHNSLGAALDKRPTTAGSPGSVPGDSYFNVRSRPGISRIDTASSAVVGGTRRASKEKESPASEMKKALQGDEKHGAFNEAQTSSAVHRETARSRATVENSTSGDSQPKQVRIEQVHKDDDYSELRDTSPSRVVNEPPLSPRKLAMRGAANTSARRPHTQLHSYGADFAATFQSIPSTTGPSRVPAAPNVVTRGSALSGPIDMPPPSDRLKTLMIDTLPAHLFVALPQTGEIVWVNSRYLTYRGQTVAELYQDPWSSIHPDEREEFLKTWGHAIRTGEQFSMQVRIRRFDGQYRWFYTRAIGGRDTRGVIVQWYGSYMDIHDQREAEVKAARQEEIEASEAKHRLLANLIPQIIFSATEDEGVTFANQQWLSYTGQTFDDALGLGFMDYVHPDDLAKCRIPTDRPPSPTTKQAKDKQGRKASESPTGGKSSSTSEVSETTVRGVHQALSRQNSSSSDSMYELPSADLIELARNGVIKISTDSDGRLSYTTEVRLRSKSGEYRWHLVRCVEVDNINFGGGDGSWFGACTDINDHKILEAKLKEAMESKGKFLSNMSHEIRTPLIGISGMVSFLQDTALNEEQLDYTNTIQTSANSLLLIINDILDLSKVDAGMMKLSYDWFHTRSLIEDVNELVSTMAIAKRLELNYVVEEDVPAMVKGDKVRIRQVLLNVIGNAIKFTTEGEVFSRCRVYRDDPSLALADDEIMLEFSVVDTGRGFSEEEAELIFKPFSQIDGSSTRQHGGSGLGLVISRQLAELHGGSMHGTAVPGKGSTFTFTAKFGLPTPGDHPEAPLTPAFKEPSSARSSVSAEISARALKSAGGNPVLAHRFIATATSPISPKSYESSVLNSSASSDPSVQSARSHTTERSSSSSMNAGLSHFKEAARASSQELILELPGKSSEGSTPTQVQRTLSLKSKERIGSPNDVKQFRPPMYSILLICPQTHSREATTKHIEMTLPKDVPHQITALGSIVEAQKLISGEDPVIFTHIVLNLGSPEDIISLMDQIFASVALPQTSIVILSDPVQRQAVMKLASEYDYEQLAKDNRVIFIYKPVKPSRFAVIFDPDKERDLSTDRNRFNAQQQVADQKQNYLDVEKRLGNRGFKLLLVEDNLVNQKVLLKFLGKVGISVETALDGVECTDKVYTQPAGYYSLILCDLHMPRKDGYQTCREIRSWEKKNKLRRIPMIALSANVMADVVDKCVAAGFDSYVTKPVDFKELSTAMSSLLDPDTTTKSK